MINNALDLIGEWTHYIRHSLYRTAQIPISPRLESTVVASGEIQSRASQEMMDSALDLLRLAEAKHRHPSGGFPVFVQLVVLHHLPTSCLIPPAQAGKGMAESGLA
jgi:hypothetical protein